MSTKILTIEDLESSKIYQSDSDVIRFEHPMDYLSPFIELFNSINPTWNIEGQLGGVNKNKAVVVDDLVMPEEVNISYSRVLARAKLPEEYDINFEFTNNYNHLTSEIGMVYALDGRNPEIKVYAGRRVTACINQCIFGADSILTINLLKSSKEAAYNQTRRYLETIEANNKVYLEKIHNLKERELSGSKLLERIGKIVWEAKKNPKLGIICASDMVTYIQDPKSKYALVDNKTTDWMLYNACTESLKKSNILDEASKVLLLENVFIN